MISLRADWILPITGPPIRDGFVAVDEDRIVAIDDRPPAGSVHLGRVAVLPALVNAHTHLELSYLHERVPASTSFNDWVVTLMALRRGFPDPAAADILAAAAQGVAQARASGTGLIGDISNTLVTVQILRDAGMAAHVFHELMGFNIADPGERVGQARARAQAAGLDERGVRVSLAPHAPYSVSPELFMAIRADVDAHPNTVSTVHLGESADEVELLRHGTGVTRAMLEKLGVWTDAWQVPGVSPVEYLANLGFLDSRVLVVHGVQCDGGDLGRLRAMGSTLVSCPRSNQHVGVGEPPLEAFYATGVSVAFGTDSLASVADLNMFAELAEARRIAPCVPARQLLQSATLTAAHALGFERDFGSIEKGKRAALIAVRVPAGVDDVEEYLVSGVEPGDISWLPDGSRSQLGVGS
ncbi:MAG TPA: amidohydrolase family protein [Vicinamibacterales bacterium]|nr:amidohydrolase family protein [Vicinamibacterales bacterium]